MEQMFGISWNESPTKTSLKSRRPEKNGCCRKKMELMISNIFRFTDIVRKIVSILSEEER